MQTEEFRLPLCQSSTTNKFHNLSNQNLDKGVSVDSSIKTVVAVPLSFLLNAKIVAFSDNDDYMTVDKHFFQFCLRPILEKVRVDEDWYLSRYPDVLNGLERGAVSSATEHYAKHGYFENRMPYAIKVDTGWYLEQHPDVKEAIGRKLFASAQAHFDSVGFIEGRLPYPDFTLSTVLETGDLASCERLE
jgi:hypothetical protein